MALDSNGDRMDSYEVMNFVLEPASGAKVLRSVAVGVFNSTLGQYKAYERIVVWPGGTTEVPADYAFQGDCCTPGGKGGITVLD